MAKESAKAPAELVPGTLELLILKAISLGTQHGYGVLLRIGQITDGALQIEQGALYPALYRLEHRAWWTPSGAPRKTIGAPSITA